MDYLKTEDIISTLLKAQKDHPDGEVSVDKHECFFSYPDPDDKDTEFGPEWIIAFRCREHDFITASLDNLGIKRDYE